MTQTKKRALYTLAIWGFAAGGFAAMFFSGGGPAAFDGDKGRIVSTAILIGFGFLMYFIMLYLTRSRPDVTPLIVDERDESIASRASAITLVVVLAVVYLACIVLWEVYREQGCVPVGWMWFLGYANAMMGFLTHATVTLILDQGMGGHGQS